MKLANVKIDWATWKDEDEGDFLSQIFLYARDRLIWLSLSSAYAAEEPADGAVKTDADFNYDDMPKGDPAASPVRERRRQPPLLWRRRPPLAPARPTILAVASPSP